LTKGFSFWETSFPDLLPEHHPGPHALEITPALQVRMQP